MADRSLGTILRHIHKLAASQRGERLNDAQLLERFVHQRDARSFEAIVHRHGPLVWRVCRRLVGHDQSAEDAFQATFLVLARRAHTIRKSGSLACWLHGVASRVARKARPAGGLVQMGAEEVESGAPDPADQAAWRELGRIVEEEVNGLAEKYRAPILLCYWEGLTNEETAQQLGCPPGTIKTRLAKARQLLHARLIRRGVGLSIGAVLTVASSAGANAGVPARLVVATANAALPCAGSTAVAVPAAVTVLAESVLQGMAATKLKSALVVLLVIGTLGAGAGVISQQVFAEKQSVSPSPVAAPKAQAAPATGDASGAEGGAKAKGQDPRAGGERPARTDAYGDPLPPGALARLGTVRFRHKDFVRQAVFGGDGKTLIAGEFSGLIVFWDAATGKELRRFESSYYGDILCSLAVARDGKTLAAGGGNSIRLFEPATGRLLREWKSPQMAFLVFSPDGKTLASHSFDDLIYLWDPATGAKRRELKGHRGRVMGIAFSPDGKELVSGGDDSVRLWDVATGREVRELKGHGNVSAVAWSPDGKTVASSGDFTLRFWDRATGRERTHMKDDNRGAPAPITYLPDGSALVGLQHTTIRLYDPVTGKVLRSFAPALHTLFSVTVSPDGKTVAAGGGHLPELWDVATGKLLCPAEGHRLPVRALAFNGGGKILFSCGGSVEYALRVWDPTTGKELRRVGEGTNGSDALALSPDGTLLAVAHNSGEYAGVSGVSLRDADNGREVRRLKHPGVVVSIHFSADGKRLASYSVPYASGEPKTRSIRLWDVATGKPGVVIDAGQGEIGPAAFSPDGKVVVAAGGFTDGTVRSWDADTGKELGRFEVEEKWAEAVAFSPDGRTLAIGGRGVTSLWDPATGKRLRTLRTAPDARGFSERTFALAFSPDGRTLAVGGEWGATTLWEVSTAQVRATLSGHLGSVGSLAFTADGRLLASGSADTTILVWDRTRLGTQGQSAKVQLASAELDRLWNHLASADTRDAYQALCTLAAAPVETEAFLAKHLRPVLPADSRRIAKWIANLDDNRFEVRQKATDELEKLGEGAVGALRKALEARPSLEVRRRLEQLLAKQDRLSPERLQMMRAIELLEHIATAEARRVLEALAQGAAGAQLTQEAKASLDRLAKRPVAP